MLNDYLDHGYVKENKDDFWDETYLYEDSENY
jgi:hypothetical protein